MEKITYDEYCKASRLVKLYDKIFLSENDMDTKTHGLYIDLKIIIIEYEIKEKDTYDISSEIINISERSAIDIFKEQLNIFLDNNNNKAIEYIVSDINNMKNNTIKYDFNLAVREVIKSRKK